jgi:hypothetical protein
MIFINTKDDTEDIEPTSTEPKAKKRRELRQFTVGKQKPKKNED